jgi:hypothetical protein
MSKSFPILNIMQKKIQYTSQDHNLKIPVDDFPSDKTDIIVVKPIKHLAISLNLRTGGICELNINIKSICDDVNVSYNDDEDCLQIHLLEEDKHPIGCDSIYLDADAHNLIAFNRNRVGNLTGIEIVGLMEIIDKHADNEPSNN